MTYSSAIFNTPKDDLYTAQQNKYRSLAEALEIKSDDSVLEVGSGWGGMAIFLATNYGCHVRTITISRQQFAYVKQQIENLKLTDHITVEYMDYRHLTGKYDKIVSIEMVEAVGHRYMPDYFTALSRCLKQDGLLGIQAITAPDARYDDYRRGLSWLQKHIFPGSLLPSLNYILHTANRMGGLQLHKHRDIGQHYIKTLELWRDRFEQNIEQLSNMGFDETFCRKWRYYLAYCIAAFASRNASDVQIVLTRPNNLNLDDSVLQQGA